MWMLGLLLVGLAAGSLIDSSEEDDGTPIERDGEEGRLREGNDGDDRIGGTDGPDILSGEDGDDTLNGSDGKDVLLGGNGDDTLNGNEGADYLTAGEGDDLLNGGEGNDTLVGYRGDDTLIGGQGDDVLVGVDVTDRDHEVDDFFVDRITPSPVNSDQVPTEAEANNLDGGDGDDMLVLGEGDTGTGGDGNDLFQVGEWVEEDAPVITDFDPDEDLLSLLYERSTGAPTVTIERTSGETHVLANDVIMARLIGEVEGLEATDVILTAT